VCRVLLQSNNRMVEKNSEVMKRKGSATNGLK
jgi:hypothetical protein